MALTGETLREFLMKVSTLLSKVSLKEVSNNCPFCDLGKLLVFLFLHWK